MRSDRSSLNYNIACSTQAKELIRRAKAWRNTQWREPGCGGKPKSYLISLLVYYAYEKEYDEDMNMEELAQRVKERLIEIVNNYEDIDIV